MNSIVSAGSNCATCHWFESREWRCKNAPDEVLLVHYQNTCKGDDWLLKIKEPPKEQTPPTATPLFGDWKQ